MIISLKHHTLIAHKIDEKHRAGLSVTGNLLNYLKTYNELTEIMSTFKTEGDSIARTLSYDVTIEYLNGKVKIIDDYGCTEFPKYERIGGILLVRGEIPNPDAHEKKEKPEKGLEEKYQKKIDFFKAKFKKIADEAYPKIHALYIELNKIAEKIS